MKEMSNKTRIIFTEAVDNDLLDKCNILMLDGERGDCRSLTLNSRETQGNAKASIIFHAKGHWNYLDFVKIYFYSRETFYQLCKTAWHRA